jgi:site-specific recombinase XerC
VTYYQCAFAAWRKHSNGCTKQFVMNLREAGLSAVSINTYICAMNAYWRWAGEPTHLQYLQEEQKVLATFTAQHVRQLLASKSCSRQHRSSQRLHALVCLLLDTGLRISEALGLSKTDVDLDNAYLKVVGKGRKERLVPISVEMRRVLFRWMQHQRFEVIFSTRNGARMTPRNVEREFKRLCRKLGITGVRCSPHTLRHTFENSHGFYVQDSFRLTPRLTLNYGLRWDYFGVVGEKDNLLYRFDPASGGTLTATSGSKGLYDPDYNNFAPRLAFAWDIFGKGKSVKDAMADHRELVRWLDRAVSSGVLHKNTVARRKSQAAKLAAGELVADAS